MNLLNFGIPTMFKNNQLSDDLTTMYKFRLVRIYCFLLTKESLENGSIMRNNIIRLWCHRHHDKYYMLISNSYAYSQGHEGSFFIFKRWLNENTLELQILPSVSGNLRFSCWIVCVYLRSRRFIASIRSVFPGNQQHPEPVGFPLCSTLNFY